MRDEPLRAVPKPAKREKATHRNAAKRGKYAEKRVAEDLGGRQTISSGRTSLEKGDVTVDTPPLFVEVKYVGERAGKGKDSITFDRKWMEKTLLDARAVNKLPVVALRFSNGEHLYVAPGSVFEALVKQIRDLSTNAHSTQLQP